MQQEMCIILDSRATACAKGLSKSVAAGEVALLLGRSGSGKSIVLRELQASIGGVLVEVRDLKGALEETFLQVIERALAEHDIVIVDDLHLVTGSVNAREYHHSLLLDAALTAILGEASALRKRLVFAMDGEAPWPIRRRATEWTIQEFAAARS